MSDSSVPAVTETTRTAFGQSSGWLRFLAILGFIGAGLLVVVGIGLAIFGGAFMGAFGVGFLGPVLGLIYVGLGVLIFFPSLTLLQTAGKAKAFGAEGKAADLEGVAVGIRRLARFYGILAIVYLAIIVIALVAGLAGGLMMMPHE